MAADTRVVKIVRERGLGCWKIIGDFDERLEISEYLRPDAHPGWLEVVFVACLLTRP